MEEISGSQAPVDQSPCLPAGTKGKVVTDSDSTVETTDNGECKTVMIVCIYIYIWGEPERAPNTIETL